MQSLNKLIKYLKNIIIINYIFFIQKIKNPYLKNAFINGFIITV